MFANNLLNGFYSPPPPDINLWNGPGYPLLMAILLFFKLPILGIRLFNGVLLYLSLILTFKTINTYASRKEALFFTVLLGLYYPIYPKIPLVLTEAFAWFLISLIGYLFVKHFKEEGISRKYTLITAFSIAFLALTKIIFGYVILSMIILSLALYLIPTYRKAAKQSFIIFSLALVFCIPYLTYTYQLTDKVFYWADSGGMSLYTMSTPYEGELGDWRTKNALLNLPNHRAFIDSIYTLPPIQRDDAYRAKAIENIKNHPGKYFGNWVANVGRLLFSFPYSDAKQSPKTMFTVVPNMFVIVFILLAAAIAIISKKKLPTAFIFLLFFILIYLFGNSLVSAYRRMFYITIPFWVMFFSYVFTNFITIRLRKN